MILLVPLRYPVRADAFLGPLKRVNSPKALFSFLLFFNRLVIGVLVNSRFDGRFSLFGTFIHYVNIYMVS